MTIQIPDTIFQRLGLTESEMKLEIAIWLFQKEVFTLAQAAQFAGIHNSEFQKELGVRKIAVHYDEGMLENDVNTLTDLFGASRQ